MSTPKKPQDHKRKADADPLEQVRAEAKGLPGLDAMAGIKITVTGRNGTATVTTIDDPFEWDAEVIGLLGAGDYLGAICGMLSDEEGTLLRAMKPSIRSLMSALMDAPEDSGEPSLGESQAS